jgi:hypothetical protein
MKNVFEINFYHGVTIFSRLIRFRTWSEISHVSVTTPQGLTYEAVPMHGVVRHSGLDAFHTPGTQVEVFRFPIHDPGPGRIEAGIQWLNEQVGKGYDYRGIAGFLARKNINNTDKWFCSELVMAFSLVVWKPLLLRRRPDQVDPADLYSSPLLTADRHVTVAEAPQNKESA